MIFTIACIIFTLLAIGIFSLLLFMKEPDVVENDKSTHTEPKRKTMDIIVEIPKELTLDDELEIANVVTAYANQYIEDLTKSR